MADVRTTKLLLLASRMLLFAMLGLHGFTCQCTWAWYSLLVFLLCLAIALASSELTSWIKARVPSLQQGEDVSLVARAFIILVCFFTVIIPMRPGFDCVLKTPEYTWHDRFIKALVPAGNLVLKHNLQVVACEPCGQHKQKVRQWCGGNQRIVYNTHTVVFSSPPYM